MIRRVSTVALLSVFSAVAWGQGAGPYPIKFDRPFQVGQVFSLTVDDTTRTTQKSQLPDGSSQASATYLHFGIKGTLTVTKLDDRGLEAQSDLVLDSFTKQTADPTAKATDPGAKPATLVTAGSKITITYGAGDVAFAVDKGTLSTDAKAGLAEIFKAHLVNDDERFGSATPRKVGESWPIHVDTMLAAMKSQGITADMISGDVTLHAVGAVNGVNCAQVEVKTTIKNMPVPNLPPGGTAKEFTLTSTAVSDLPTDLAVPRLGSAVKSATHLVLETKPNGAGLVTSTVDSEKTKITAMTPK